MSKLGDLIGTRAEELLKENERYQDLLKLSNDGCSNKQVDEEILSIKKKTVKRVIKEYRDSPLVEEMFMYCIERQGQAFKYIWGDFYYNTCFQIINDEVNKMLMSHYKERLQEVKSQLDNDDLEKE